MRLAALLTGDVVRHLNEERTRKEAMMPDFPEGVTDDLNLMLRLHEGIWAGDLNRVVAALERGAAPM